jgi:hypothetical protein
MESSVQRRRTRVSGGYGNGNGKQLLHPERHDASPFAAEAVQVFQHLAVTNPRRYSVVLNEAQELLDSLRP